jgi:hypothetical protein
MFVVFINVLMAQEITLGSSLKGLTSHITNETKAGITDLGVWIENKIYLYEISPRYSLLISGNYYPFGILVKDDISYFLMDIDGDSTLDVQTKYLHVPHWVVFLNSKEKNNNKNIVNIFDLWYELFQSNERNSESVSYLGREYVQAGNNLTYTNRDLIYLHQLYDSLYSLGDYQLGLRYLSILDNEMISRFGNGTHVITLIYIVETLYKLNEYDKAAAMNNMLLEHIPDCIPAMVYQVLLETNAVEKNRLRGLLLRNYSDHWLVKNKLL